LADLFAHSKTPYSKLAFFNQPTYFALPGVLSKRVIRTASVLVLKWGIAVRFVIGRESPHSTFQALLGAT
jgi:hypothetical protein